MVMGCGKKRRKKYITNKKNGIHLFDLVVLLVFSSRNADIDL